MKLAYLLCAALVAASPALARDKKKKETAPPPAPVVEYELDDPHMAEPLAEACISVPADLETYDSRDNVMIVKTEAGRAFFHLKGACSTNVMIFADTIAAAKGGQCVKPGDGVVFTSSYGDKTACEVKAINRWLDDEPIADD